MNRVWPKGLLIPVPFFNSTILWFPMYSYGFSYSFSYGFPIVSYCFPNGFPIVFPIVFPMVPYGFPKGLLIPSTTPSWCLAFPGPFFFQNPPNRTHFPVVQTMPATIFLPPFPQVGHFGEPPESLWRAFGEPLESVCKGKGTGKGKGKGKGYRVGGLAEGLGWIGVDWPALAS